MDADQSLERAATLLEREGVLTIEDVGSDRRVQTVTSRAVLLRYYANLAEGALG